MTNRWMALLGIVLLTAAQPRAKDTATPAATPASPGAAASPAPKPVKKAKTVFPVVTTPSGLKYQLLRRGKGAGALLGQTVSVHYTGWLTNGTKFDSSVDRGQPFQFTLGAGQVIKGWDEGVAGMKVGEERTVSVAPALGSRA